MKCLRIFPALIFSIGLFLSCGKIQESQIVGTYSTQTVEWSSEIDLAGVEYPQNNLLNQLGFSGWYGLQTIQSAESSPASPFSCNRVSAIDDRMFDILLFLPFPNCNPDRSMKVPTKGTCNVFVDEFRIRCKRNGANLAEILKVSDSDFFSNPQLYFKDNSDEIIFEADTYYFDWTIEDFQEGHIIVRLMKNPTTLITSYE